MTKGKVLKAIRSFCMECMCGVFKEIENWLKEVKISEDKKRFIIEKTELLKKRSKEA
jgi:hypothetical protein